MVVVIRNPERARRDRRKMDREITEIHELMAKVVRELLPYSWRAPK